MTFVKSRFALPSILVTLALSACLGNSGNSTAPPTGARAYAGDGAISLTWNVESGVEYWVFYAQDPALSTLNWTTLAGAGALVNAGMPSILCNLINNPSPTPLYQEIYFTVDGRTGTSPGGSGSPLVGTSPRPAGGGPTAPWIAGTTIPTGLTGLGYGAIYPCGYAGRPPSGLYVAVGPGGAVFYSLLAPIVAGPLAAAQGNTPMTWTAGNVPPGFNQNLVGVASISGIPNPAAPVYTFVAVGQSGTILRSTDGQNWQQVTGVPTNSNLNAVAATGYNFIAVGDGGVVLIGTPDGLTWSASAAAAAASSNTLNAIHCVGASCVAVGTSGTTLWSSQAGADWTLYTNGTNNWIGIAYGNKEANADVVVCQTCNPLTVTINNQYINTWVVVDAQGDYAYTQTVGGWINGNLPIASSITAIDYTTRFVALDGTGNAYASESGNSWQAVGASGVASPTAMVSNGQGFVAVGATGTNASSF